MSLQKYRVAVYNNHGGLKKHTNRPLAYLRYFTYYACTHEVTAHTGIEAKRVAISEHLSSRLCSDRDPYCHDCPGLSSKI